ncbi:ComF family protein [Mesorhizobium sp. M8A.F.Ca.ET.208.01.1.1]|nr:ComF family protein [Mesorhizobium sp. M8A.F.Ca.ET.057.01.1.1]RUX00281.1 ComF family protein [Mesorhizobium sp. M8A.F.Ca.ET.059.01.1.1]RWE50158.1 MAG: ComF family protein [Mesorhizobium sp.]TGQ95943.1 ComF family protein [Mesorhizobium sp. M8A.F.Ca.ET.208.01.1.1]TGT56434.1 ComF family protein [Mesorhizobium sp. M8A.F.Ca.ET.167.01.1.1]
MVKINPIKIEGRWHSGIALDLHTTSSTPTGPNEFGHMQFDTVRPEIAELLFRLKNRADKDAAGPIIESTANFLAQYRDKFDCIVPVPPSHQRALQPVIVLAEGIGAALGVPVLSCITTTRSTSQLKNVTDPEERKKQVEGLYQVDATQTQGRSILLFDDLFRSGTTMNAITDELLGPGKAASVRALTITKTRSNH